AKTGEAAATRHLPVRKLRIAAVEQISKARFGNRQRRLRHQVISEPTDERDTGEHRIRRADRGEECRAYDMGIADVVKPAVGIRHRLIWIIAHSERACFVMRRAEPVATANAA